jgi:hypothetical protein
LQTDIIDILQKSKEILDVIDQRITVIEEKTTNTSNSVRYDLSLLQELINELAAEIRNHD